MVVYAANDHSSVARSEQSLLRSLSVIHRSTTTNHGSDNSDNSGSHINVSQDSLSKRDRSNRVIRSRRTLPCTCDRREILDTSPPSPTSIHEELPAYPFCKEPRLPCPAKKFQRRLSPATDNVNVAQPMVPKVTREKQRERRRLMEVRMTMADSNESHALVSKKNKSRRRASVTFAPLPTSSDTGKKQARAKEQHNENGFRGDYAIGETIRSSSHMIIEPTPRQALQSISSLKDHDFAFVKRSDGSYSYAIMAYRSMEPIKGDNNNNGDDTKSVEECMTFVMSDDGSTKMVRKSKWIKLVRLVRSP